MKEQETFSKLAREVSYAFLPIKEAISSVDNFTGFMLQMGWDVFQIPKPIENLTTPLNILIEKLEDGIGLDDVSSITAALTSLIDNIQELKNSPASLWPPLLLEDEFLTEFPAQLTHFLIFDYLNKKYCNLTAYLLLLGLIKSKYVEATGNRPAYFRRQIMWDGFMLLLYDPKKY